MKNKENRVRILLIQNQESTLRTVQQTLESNKTRCRLQMVGICTATLSYLRREEPYTDAPVPDLVLFDLSDASPASIAVVKAIKADKHCRSLPMVLLTSRDSEDEVVKLVSKRGQDNAFSPVDLDSFIKALNSFKPDRFMHAVTLLENFGYVLVRMPQAPVESRPVQMHQPTRVAACM